MQEKDRAKRKVKLNKTADIERPAKRSNRVNSLTRVVQILDFLVKKQAPISPYAVAKATNAPVSTIYSTIDEMERHGLLQRGKDGTIWIGAHLYYYGLAYSSQLDFLQEAKMAMVSLRDEVDETVQISGRDNTSLVVMDMAEANTQFQMASNVGTRLPLNWTASGLLLVGHLPHMERLKILKECALKSPTGKAETNPEVLSQAASKSFKARLAVQAGQADYMVCCIASPICNENNECLATISIVLPDSRAENNKEYYVQAVRRAAMKIESRMGWQKT